MNVETPAEALPVAQGAPVAPTSADAPREAPCATCGQLPLPANPPVAVVSPHRFVYAVGRLRAEFPDDGVAHEFAQLTGVDSRALVQAGDLKEALARPESRYLAYHICWVFGGPGGGDVCTVHPRDSHDIDELLDLLGGDDDDVEALVGAPASPALVSACTAPGLAAVTPDQVLRFTMDEFVAALPAPDAGEGAADRYRQVVRDLFAQLTQRAGNLGTSDEHRALNFLALRYPPLYQLAFRVVGEGKALVGVDPRHATAGGRRVVSVRLVFRDHRSHLVERYHCTVDVTDLFPFLTSSLSQTFD